MRRGDPQERAPSEGGALRAKAPDRVVAEGSGARRDQLMRKPQQARIAATLRRPRRRGVFFRKGLMVRGSIIAAAALLAALMLVAAADAGGSGLTIGAVE